MVCGFEPCVGLLLTAQIYIYLKSTLNSIDTYVYLMYFTLLSHLRNGGMGPRERQVTFSRVLLRVRTTVSWHWSEMWAA